MVQWRAWKPGYGGALRREVAVFQKIKAKLAASQEAYEASRLPSGVRVINPSKMRTTGGTNWSLNAPAPPDSRQFPTLNTEQFLATFGPRSDD